MELMFEEGGHSVDDFRRLEIDDDYVVIAPVSPEVF